MNDIANKTNERENQPAAIDAKSNGQGDRELSRRVYDLLAKEHPNETEFRVLLAHLSPGVLAKRYLLTGLPFVFREQPHKYLAFREAVGRIFGVRPQDIAVMGSARFGFSTNPRNQSESGAKLLDHDSDMDLVIVARDTYEESLESFANFTFDALRDVGSLKSDPKAENDSVSINKVAMLAIRRRAKGFTYGYVNPADFEDGTPEKQRFYDMKREAGTQLFGTAPPGPINRVGAWIYRDWDAAERMYEFSFRQLARAWDLHAGDDAETPIGIDESDSIGKIAARRSPSTGMAR